MMAQSEPWKTLGRDYEASLRSISDPAKEVYVALLDGKVAGFVVINMHGAFVGYIQSVCVAPGQRGNGIGSALLEYAEQRILREAPNVFVCVSSFNSGARRLYERLGYAVVGELRDYIVKDHSEILLRKTIGPLQGFTRADSVE
jgi:ribosomal protein S18 acetylase RimI-like enzyme